MNKVDPHPPPEIAVTTATDADTAALPESLVKLKEEARALRLEAAAREAEARVERLASCLADLERCLAEQFPAGLVPFLDRDRLAVHDFGAGELEVGKLMTLFFRVPGHSLLLTDIDWADGEAWRRVHADIDRPAGGERWHVQHPGSRFVSGPFGSLGEAMLEAEAPPDDDVPF
jgi:hypothetical protein